jgi:tetratricopeptide (TPR) repeat protein
VVDLRALAQRADAQGRKYVSVDASVLLAEALIKNKDIASARQELERTLGRSEKLGLRLQTARIHYFLGTALRFSGNTSESATQYREAARLLNDIRKEQGAEHLTERPDLKVVAEESQKFAQ